MDRNDTLNHLWEEIKFRQEHYWSSFNKFGLVNITVMVIPFIRPEIVELLGKAVIIFPSISLILSCICMWYLAAEYQRLRMVRRKYEEILSEDCMIPRMPRETRWERMIAARIGSRTSTIWGFSFIFASVSTIIILVLLV